jgi:hypothetical protein
MRSHRERQFLSATPDRRSRSMAASRPRPRRERRMTASRVSTIPESALIAGMMLPRGDLALEIVSARVETVLPDGDHRSESVVLIRTLVASGTAHTSRPS